MLHGSRHLGRFTHLQCVARPQWPNQWHQRPQQQQRRDLLTLAIETSCDDTAVAILETTGSLNHHSHHSNHQHHNTSNVSFHANSTHAAQRDVSSKHNEPARHNQHSLTTTTSPVHSQTAVNPPKLKDNSTVPVPVSARILFHEKVTARNTGLGGIHPVEALESHQRNLATLVSKAISSLPDATEDQSERQRTIRYPARTTTKILPDFVTVTRGPGMRSNLACGLDTAKGLAAAWQVPLVGVHHMQAHALTPRLVNALERDGRGREKQFEQEKEKEKWELEGVESKNYMDGQEQRSSFNSLSRVSETKDQTEPSPLHSQLQPQFPFLTLLVSGGHTMLVYSKGLVDHRIVATTRDIAIGDALDKCGRVILPEEVKAGMQDTAYAKYLSEWVSATTQSTEIWPVPKRRKSEIDKPNNDFGWQVQTPLAATRDTAFSFSGIATSIEKLFAERNNSADSLMNDSERLMFARTALGISFEHLGSRTIIALENLRAAGNDVSTLVVSGGVAANSFLRLFLRSMLDARGFEHVKLVFPPPWLCTDNAVMIAWSGIEMFEAGYQSQPDIRALRKWSMDPTVTDGGILGVGGWM